LKSQSSAGKQAVFLSCMGTYGATGWRSLSAIGSTLPVIRIGSLMVTPILIGGSGLRPGKTGSPPDSHRLLGILKNTVLPAETLVPPAGFEPAVLAA
jgi:hypothetical protein